MPVQPRRTFAPSVVITFVGALGVATAAPAERRLPTKNPPAPKPATSERHWRIYKQGKTCFADNSQDACPPPPAGKPAPSCNPPAPTKYACLDDVSLPATVLQHVGSRSCVLAQMPMTCPPNVSCNPPRPRTVPCP